MATQQKTTQAPTSTTLAPEDAINSQLIDESNRDITDASEQTAQDTKEVETISKEVDNISGAYDETKF